MSISLFLTDVDHCRAAPKVHRFLYRSLSAHCDLNKLMDRSKGRFIAYNRHAIFSIWDRDYLPGKHGTIRERLLAYLAQHGKPTEWERIELITSPRFLGYVFNPVSFYLCYRAGAKHPELCVAEVNNTFGETHLYLAEPDAENHSRRVAKFVTPKDFHVSPFYDRKGDYVFYVQRDADQIDIRVNLLKEGKTTFTSGVRGSIGSSTTPSPLRAIYWGLRYGWLTLPRIAWQAAILHYRKGLPVFSKPIPTSPATIGKRKPSYFERFSQTLMVRYLSRIRRGRLVIELPSNEKLFFGEAESNLTGEHLCGKLKVCDWSFFPRILLGGDVAFGECYTEGLCDSENLTVLLGVFAENVEFFNDRDIPFTKLFQRLNAIIHRRRANSKTGSQQNIPAHYDLGNELFSRFLDGRLVYSCAVFSKPEETLEEAQLNKLRAMISKVNLQPHHHLLEIGSGWGAFAIQAAKEVGCRVTTITLSEEQRHHTQQQVDAEGLSDRIQVRLCDYRDLEGQFDRIVSIEMLEAVGHEHLGAFFQICDRLLKPDGIVALQFITVPDSRYEAYRKSCDWIQKYVFPGGLCPSLTAVCGALTAHSPFVVEHLENIGPSYARTLQEWRVRFRSSSKELLALGYDRRFQRMWEYYLAYCEAGFASRTLGTLQMVLTRPNNSALGNCPGYRLTNE